MRVVNLSNKPFINRRPIVRLTVVLWLLGAILLGINVTLYRDYWLGTAENRERLATADEAIEEQLEELEVQEQALSQIRFKRQNSKAAFLNALISRRTFPWSDLFDHLEDVTPDDVRLVSVSPLVKESTEGTRTDDSTRTTRSSSTGRQNASPSNAVSLKLTGWAKSEEALTTFVDTLYREAAFGPPLLQSELVDSEAGKKAIRFNLETTFFINYSEPDALVAEETSPTDEGSEGDAEAEIKVVEKQPPPVDGNSESDDAESRDPEDNAPESEVTLANANPRPSTPPRPPPPQTTPQQQNSDEVEAIREEVEAARQGASRPESREPQLESTTRRPPDRDRQQQLEALRARAAARSRATRTPNNIPRQDQGNRGSRGNQGSQGNQGNDDPSQPGPPPNGEDGPTDTKPPASSTPRLNGIAWRLSPWIHDLLPAPQSLVWKEEINA